MTEEPDPTPTPITIEETLKTAIETAVTAAINADTPIEIKADTTWNDIETDILAAANAADGVSPNFVVIAGDTPLDTTTTSGEATITLVVQQKDLTTNSATITISGITLTTDVP